jgi:hypothetical protein
MRGLLKTEMENDRPRYAYVHADSAGGASRELARSQTDQAKGRLSVKITRNEDASTRAFRRIIEKKEAEKASRFAMLRERAAEKKRQASWMPVAERNRVWRGTFHWSRLEIGRSTSVKRHQCAYRERSRN